MIQVKELGLVAYMQMKGCTLKGYDGKNRIFNVECGQDKSLDEWSIEYSNSCCSMHDRHILSLRNVVRNNNNEGK